MIRPVLEWEKFKFMKKSKEPNPIFDEVDVDTLLNKYGPEGLYDLAQKLLDIANEDVSDSIDDIHNLYEKP